MANTQTHGFFDRLSLAAKFASALSVILLLFFILAAVVVQLRTTAIQAELLTDVANVVGEYVDNARSEAATGEIKSLIGPTMENVAFQITVMMLAITIGVVATVYLLFIQLVRKKIKGLEERFIDVCEGEGDLRRRIEVQGNDGVDRLGRHFNRFLEKVHQIMLQVAEVTGELNSRATHVNEINRASAEEILQQQTNTEHVATAMNEMTASVQEVARNVNAAAEAAQHAADEARSGQGVVDRAVDSIQGLAAEVTRANEVILRLKSDSEQIGGVLDVIRGIAEQTNLLALNAAIEAARAGEQGRGFAVVADEVRTLAGRTQKSTEEIQAMIEQLQTAANNAVAVMANGRDKAEASVDQATEAGQALARITQTVAAINEMNAQISTAAHEQSTVAGEIDSSIVRISQSASQTSLRAQDAMADSDQLVRLTNNLTNTVNQFRV